MLLVLMKGCDFTIYILFCLVVVSLIVEMQLMLWSLRLNFQFQTKISKLLRCLLLEWEKVALKYGIQTQVWVVIIISALPWRKQICYFETSFCIKMCFAAECAVKSKFCFSQVIFAFFHLSSVWFAGNLVFNLSDHQKCVSGLTFAPCGSPILVSCSLDKTLKVYILLIYHVLRKLRFSIWYFV